VPLDHVAAAVADGLGNAVQVRQAAARPGLDDPDDRNDGCAGCAGLRYQDPVARVQGVVFGQQYLMLDYDCPRSVLDDAVSITPGLESPTIAPLADPDWVAVRALVPRRGINAIMDQLAAIGAKAILASNVRFFRF